jgi:hypothetical protein
MVCFLPFILRYVVWTFCTPVTRTPEKHTKQKHCEASES